MDVPTILTMAQTILHLLDSSVMKKLGNVWSFKSELIRMKDTLSTIKAVLIDAEEQEKQLVLRSEADNVWLEKLKNVVYEADDLFDKVATLALRETLIGGKVWLFLSRPMFFFSASREIKKIRERLDSIAKDHHDFGSYGLRIQNSVDLGEGRMARKAREESHSYVRDENVVGREDDRKALIDMLLDPSVKEDVSFVTIVGMGGLGKTTLSQLAYNDAKIRKEFTRRLWVCVSQDFNLKSIILRILELLTDKRYDLFGMEQLRIKLEQEIKGKRYLLVLDDLWNEKREEWLQLRDLLIEGGRGSRILVTTRSHMVARVVGNGPTYELEGLSPKDSWCLFERMAFVEGEEQMDDELAEIGKEIVTKCANIPLAIRVISSLLYGQDKSKWRNFRDIDLIQLKQDGVLSVLKLSYYHLEPPLKSCFIYCAMFPMDYVIEKKTLIRLWIAQGFIAESNGQSAEENGEEYFLTLLYRGFFQDVVRDNNSEIISCKIPAVMHNLAQEAAKLEVLVANSGSSQFNGQLRHLSVEDPALEVFSWIASCPKGSLRTFFQLRSGGLNSSTVKSFILNGRCLRVLDFRMSSIKSLPSLKNLLHLRYLDLSCNYGLQVLPNSLAKLHNLQTLKLNCCWELKELPRGLSKLVNLKVLEIDECFKLTHMPPKISNLTGLRSLTMFVGQTGSQKQANVSELNELKALVNLTGSLTIIIRNINTYIAKDSRYLMSMSHLSHICIVWDFVHYASDGNGYSEALLNGLEPHCNLRSFHMRRYPGVRFPSWYSLRNLGAPLHKLVEISLYECTWLKYIPSMCHLPCLKTIELVKLDNLEYIENSDNDSTTLTSVWSHDSSFFPALEMLTLKTLPKLKGWQRSSKDESLVFPRLLVLQVWNCPLLTSIPLCQKVEDMELIKFNEEFCPFSISGKKAVVDPLTSVSIIPRLKRLMIDNLECLHFWPVESLQQICYMEMHGSELESLSTGEEVFRCCLTSLQSLDIFCWKQLRSLSGGGLEHLTALETLRFLSLDSLSMSADDVRPWKSFHHSLRSLELCDLPKLIDLPKGMQYLTALRALSISECRQLRALPEWISCLCSLQFLNIRDGRLQSLPKAMQDLTSLRSLVIDGCSARFKARCQAPSGEDWPQIQHIPRIDIV